jgi:hypothetical protein
MSRSVETLIADVRLRIQRLLHDEVINETIVVMQELRTALNQLAPVIRSQANALSEQQKTDLTSILLPLTSESIREALHKGELPITNGIIRSKNQILTALNVPIPDDHQEIDPRDYPNYNW